MLKENKGVTLVALVITIIVLLILAGVSIAMVAGDNGVLNQAVSASEKTAGATAKEDLSQAVTGVQSDFYADVYGGNLTSKFSSYLTDSKLGDYLTDDYGVALVKGDVKVGTDTKKGCYVSLKYKGKYYQGEFTWTSKDNGVNLVTFYEVELDDNGNPVETSGADAIEGVYKAATTTKDGKTIIKTY